MKKMAVIGGGPGGLYAAKEAAALGLSVTVFEKSKIGDNFFCAEGFVDILKLLGQPAAGVCFPINEILITVVDSFRVDSSRLNLWMIDRKTWQQSLAEEAAAAGCEILENRKISPAELPSLMREYDWVIDASGVNAVSATAFKLPKIRTAATAQYTLEGDFSRYLGKLKVTLSPDYCGYSWIFPKSERVANVGVGWFGKKRKNVRIKAELDKFLQNERLANFKVLKKTGGPIPIARRQELIIGNLMLVGDAAGFVSPLHGGGIDTACISGILAARAAAADNPAAYRENSVKILETRLQLEQKVLDLWEATSLEKLNDYAASAFADEELKAKRPLWRKIFVPEAVLLKSVLGGRLRADWERGLILDDLPLTARIIIKGVLNNLKAAKSHT